MKKEIKKLVIKQECQVCKQITSNKVCEWSLRYGYKLYCLRCGVYSHSKPKDLDKNTPITQHKHGKQGNKTENRKHIILL